MIRLIPHKLSALCRRRKFGVTAIRLALPALLVLLTGTAPAYVEQFPAPASDKSLRMRASFEVMHPEPLAQAPRIGIVRARAYVGAPVSDPRVLHTEGQRRQAQADSLLQLNQGRIVMLTAYGELHIDRPGLAESDAENLGKENSPAVSLLAKNKPVVSTFTEFSECPTPPSRLGNLRLLAARLGVAPDIFSAPLSAERYKAVVGIYAEKYNLSPELVFAIMRTESNFNPFAVSNANALGLMQVVPDTAGGEVYTFLNGQAGIPDAGLLFDPEHNIKYGTTYLHLLNRRYFGNVLNAASREMCIIAAYNGGPGAVLRVFDQDMETAVAIINNLTPQEVYQSLTTKMPNEESRRYVDVVLGRLQDFGQGSM